MLIERLGKNVNPLGSIRAELTHLLLTQWFSMFFIYVLLFVDKAACTKTVNRVGVVDKVHAREHILTSAGRIVHT